jgi:cell division protein ZapA
MANVTLSIGGRGYQVATPTGGEARIAQLGRMLDARWATADRAAAGNPERAMLLVALMLADALDEAEQRPPVGAAVSETALIRLADRLESLADALENTPPSA